MCRTFLPLNFESRPSVSIKDQKIGNSLNVVGIILEHDASVKTLLNRLDERRLETVLFHKSVHPFRMV